MSPSHKTLHVAADAKCLLHEEHHIHQWSTADWDRHFNPGIADDSDVESRQYVLNPVDGDATYVRRATEVVDSQSTPYQDIVMNWPEFALRLSHGQALNVTLLLQELSRHQVCQTACQFCHCGPFSLTYSPAIHGILLSILCIQLSVCSAVAPPPSPDVPAQLSSDGCRCPPVVEVCSEGRDQSAAAG